MSEWQDFLTALRSSHLIRSRISVHDQDREHGETLNGAVIEGQVDLDSTADISRSLSLTVSDPNDKFQFDPMGDVYADKFISVIYDVQVPDVGWVSTPVFRGPVSAYDRDGEEVHIEATGKESLMMPPVKHHPIGDPTDRTIKAYIKAVAQSYGETYFDLDAGNGKVPGSFELDPAKSKEIGVWKYLQNLADAANLRLFYDGGGYLKLAHHRPELLVYKFRDPLTRPSVGFDLTNVRNQVEVYGKDFRGKDELRARVTLSASHPLSAQSLARGGVPRILLEEVRLDHQNVERSHAVDIGNRVLAQHTKEAIDVQFDHLPVPFLELGDVCEMDGKEFVMKKFSLPLTAGSMSVGYLRAKPLAKYRAKHKTFAQRQPSAHWKKKNKDEYKKWRKHYVR